MSSLSRDQLSVVAELGYQLMAAGRLDRARRLWEGLAAEAGELEAPWRALAVIALRQGRAADAVNLAGIAHQRKPAAPAPLVLRAEALLLNGQFAEAGRDLDAALQRSPRDPDDALVLRRAGALRRRVSGGTSATRG